MTKTPKNPVRNSKLTVSWKQTTAIFALWMFAVAQPIYTLISANPTFLSSYRIGARELLYLVFLINLAIPLFIYATLYFTNLISEKVARALICIYIFTFITLFLFGVAKKLELLNNLAVTITILIATLITIGYLKIYPVRLFIHYLTPAIFLFPIHFLFFSPAKQFVWKVKKQQTQTKTISNKPPIFIVIFDEFPLYTILKDQNSIDDTYFPNFAKLAKKSYWFKNATASAAYTHHAIPAILTGKIPSDKNADTAPLYPEYPDNLFTLLSGYYKIYSLETFTSLCPENICIQITKDTYTDFLKDLFILYLHTVSPQFIEKTLPSIDRGWKGFTNHNKGKKEAELFKKFLSYIDNKKGKLYFAHLSELPHFPWNILPSGKSYNISFNTATYARKFQGRKAYLWKNRSFIEQYFIAHLLESSYVDKLLGEFLKILEQQNVFNEALVIITADHGISFYPSSYLRSIDYNTYSTIASVPLLIKLPGQKEAKIIEKNVELIDVLPTIASYLGIDIPWDIDGLDLLNKNNNGHGTIKKILNGNAQLFTYNFDNFLKDKEKYLAYKIKLLQKTLKHNLVGTKISKGSYPTSDSIQATIHNKHLIAKIDKRENLLPLWLEGELFAINDEDLNGRFAVALNGTIVNTFIPYKKGARNSFNVILDEKHLKENNNITLIKLTHAGELLIVKDNTSFYVLQDNKIISNEGKINITRSPLYRGRITKYFVDNNQLKMIGFITDWGSYKKIHTYPEIIIFINGKMVGKVIPSFERFIVGRGSLAKKPGFEYTVSITTLEKTLGIKETDIYKRDERVFAIDKSKNIAIELTLPSTSALFKTYNCTKTTKYISCGTKKFTVTSDNKIITGNLEQIETLQNGNMVIRGWAIDKISKREVDSILVFYRDKFIGAIRPNVFRGDVVAHFGGIESLAFSGFNAQIPLSQINYHLNPSLLEIWAVSNTTNRTLLLIQRRTE